MPVIVLRSGSLTIKRRYIIH